MQSWIKIVDPAAMEEGQLYFLGRHWNVGTVHEHCDFFSRGLDGKACMSEKPGIAIRFTPNEARATIARNPTVPLVPILVPADADKRWKARQPVRK